MMCVLSFFFFFLAKVVRLFWKINETEEKEIRDFYNVLYKNYNYVSFRNVNNEKVDWGSHLVSHTYAFVLVVSDVMCVFSAETHFLAFNTKTIELWCAV